MVKLFWKCFVTGVLCNSLLLINVNAQMLSDIGSVASRLEMMQQRLTTLTPGTKEYNDTQNDIAKLTEQQARLIRQTGEANTAESRANQACPDKPDCSSLTSAAREAGAAVQTTLGEISADAATILTRTKTDATDAAGVKPTLSDADKVALGSAMDDMNSTIADQKQLLKKSTEAADAATTARKNAEDHAKQLRDYANSNASINGDHHTQDLTAAANAEALVPPLITDEAKAIAKKDNDEKVLNELEDKKNKLETDAADKKDKATTNMNTDLGIALGTDKLDNSKKFSEKLADGTTTQELSDADKAMYDSALLADITMVIAGTVTSRLKKACKAVPAKDTPPDITTAASAGLVFITGEVAEYTKLIKVRANLQSLMKEINGDPSDRQIQALTDLRTSYEKIHEAVKQKITLREGARDLFYTASDAAASAALDVVNRSNSCNSELSSKESKGANNVEHWIWGISAACLASVGYSGVGDWSFPWGPCFLAGGYLYNLHESCKEGGEESSRLSSERQNVCNDISNGTHIHAKAECPDTKKDCTEKNKLEISTEITSACLAYPTTPNQGYRHPQDYGCGDKSDYGHTGLADKGKGPYSACDVADRTYETNMVKCPFDDLDGSRDPKFYEITDKFKDNTSYIKPQKNYIEIVADIIFNTASAGTLSSMGVSKESVVGFIKKQSPIFAGALNTQLAAPMWRTVTWRALGLITDSSIATTKAMRDQIQADIDKINAIINGVKKQMGLGNNGHKSDYGASNNYKALDTNIEQLPCITGSNVGSCKSVTNALKSSPGYADLPTSVKALTAKAAGIADGLNNSSMISSGTMSQLADLSNSSNAIKIELAKREKALQRAMGRNGYKIDIAKEADKFADKLKSITKSGLSASGMSAQEMRSMMSGGDGSGSGTGTKSHAPTNNKKPSSGADAFASGFGAGAGRGGATSSNGDDGKKGDGLTDAERAARLAAEAQANKAGASVDAAKMGDTVNEDNGYTLFEVITNRYQKSAYPRLFKKVKE